MDAATDVNRIQLEPMSMPNHRARLLLAGLLALIALLWNVVEDVPALLTPGYSLYQVVWMRYAVHLAFLLLFLALRGQLARVRTRRPALQVGRGLLMLAMPFCFITALGYTSVAGVMAIFWVAPFMVLALAALLERDVARWPTWLATGVAFAAVFLILRPDRLQVAPRGALLALGMAFSFSLYVVLTRTLRSEPTATNLFYTAATVLVPLSFVMPWLWKNPSMGDMLVMVVVGLGGLGILWALDRACALAPASALAPYLLAAPVLAALLQPLLSSATLGRSALLGVAVAAAAGLLAWWSTQFVRIGEHAARVPSEEGGL